MLQDTDTIESKYQIFIEAAASSKLVWALKDKKGWANSHAAEDENVAVVPFWPDKASAKNCARDDWKGYLPVSVPLAEFLESWCMEMDENDTLVGANWDANMLGKEAGAIDVALAILNRLNDAQSAITFVNYGSAADFISDLEASRD